MSLSRSTLGAYPFTMVSEHELVRQIAHWNDLLARVAEDLQQPAARLGRHPKPGFGVSTEGDGEGKRWWFNQSSEKQLADPLYAQFAVPLNAEGVPVCCSPRRRSVRPLRPR